MGRPITVTIDSDDLKRMFFDRVAFWDRNLSYDAQQLFCDYYAELVDDGVIDGMKDFNVANIVDNDVVNEIDVLSKKISRSMELILIQKKAPTVFCTLMEKPF